ncbi:MAG: CaiB/BaiF CoA-transferase family protein [Nitratireductor sp.]
MQPEAPEAEEQLPLKGIRVADFTHVIAGPLATQILGDLGAKVTKIEEVTSGDVGRSMAPYIAGQSHYHLAFNRNKRSIGVNLKDPRGLAAVRKIVARSDILVENFSPGSMARMGLGYDDVRAFNPGIIYCSISGFGQEGPLASKGYYDLVGQAYAGVMSTNGEPDGPPVKVGIPIGDTSGSLFAVIAILSALHGRRKSGEGKYIDLSLYDCLLSVLANYGGYYLARDVQPQRTGSKHYYSVPYGSFSARDGDVVIGVFTDVQWQSFCAVLGLQQLARDDRFSNAAGRVEHREQIDAAVNQRLSQLSAEEVVSLLDSASIPCGPVHDIGQALFHPHAQLRRMVKNVTHGDYGAVRVISHPFGGLGASMMSAPPLHGEHSGEILSEIGMPAKKIMELMSQGVVTAPPGHEETTGTNRRR